MHLDYERVRPAGKPTSGKCMHHAYAVSYISFVLLGGELSLAAMSGSSLTAAGCPVATSR